MHPCSDLMKGCIKFLRTLEQSIMQVYNNVSNLPFKLKIRALPHQHYQVKCITTIKCGNMSESGEEHMLTQMYHEGAWHYTEHDCAESNKYKQRRT